MYTINNIVRKAIEGPTNRLSIIVLNEDNDDYIKHLLKLDHDFFFLHNQEPKDLPFKPDNMFCGSNSLDGFGQNYFDAVISFNRDKLYEYGNNISRALHIPMVSIDYASSFVKVPHPFFSTLKADHPERLLLNNGHVTVGITDLVTRSWYSNYISFPLTITPPAEVYHQHTISLTQKKILVDSHLPKDYFDSLRLKVNGDSRFTFDPTQADIYLHLMQTVTPLMLSCMASAIPVVTFQSKDFEEIGQKEACMFIADPNKINDPNFVNMILNFEKLEHVINNAKEYTKDFTVEAFNTKWNHLLKYFVANTYYSRG